MDCSLSFTFLTLTRHIGTRKALWFGMWGILFGTEISLKILCDEATNEVRGNDVASSLRDLFTHSLP
jgi:hypothetical protein